MNKDVQYLDFDSLERLTKLIEEKKDIKAINPHTKRKVKLYSQEKMAEAAQTGKDHLNDFLTGKQGLGKEKFNRLLDYLEVDYDYIIGNTEYPNANEKRKQDNARFKKKAISYTQQKEALKRLLITLGYSDNPVIAKRYHIVSNQTDPINEYLPVDEELISATHLQSSEGDSVVCEYDDYEDFTDSLIQQIDLQMNLFIRHQKNKGDVGTICPEYDSIGFQERYNPRY